MDTPNYCGFTGPQLMELLKARDLENKVLKERIKSMEADNVSERPQLMIINSLTPFRGRLRATPSKTSEIRSWPSSCTRIWPM
jgi:hypothetical protein